MNGLDICDFEGYKQEISKAGKNGSIGSLMECLVHLTLSSGLVRLRHVREGEFAVAWIDKKGEIYMRGGLLHFPSDNTWAVHT